MNKQYFILQINSMLQCVNNAEVNTMSRYNRKGFCKHFYPRYNHGLPSTKVRMLFTTLPVIITIRAEVH